MEGLMPKACLRFLFLPALLLGALSLSACGGSSSAAASCQASCPTTTLPNGCHQGCDPSGKCVVTCNNQSDGGATKDGSKAKPEAGSSCGCPHTSIPLPPGCSEGCQNNKCIVSCNSASSGGGMCECPAPPANCQVSGCKNNQCTVTCQA